jgi:phosphonate transport system permease protein
MADKKSLPKILTILLSIVLPGLGQVFQRRIRAGVYVFIAFATALGITAWYAKPLWYSIPALIWLWNIWDAAAFPKGKGVVIPVLFWLIMAYGIGSQVTEFNLKALVENANRSRSIITQMFRLDFYQPKTEKLEGYTDIQAPCSVTPPVPDRTINGIRIYVEEPCAAVGGTITVHGEGFWPNETTVFYWQNPIGGKAMQETAVSDANGDVTLVWTILPIIHTTAPDPTVPQIHRIKVSQSRPIGGIELSDVGGYIVQGIYETLALAFLSTIIGAILAIPFAFLAARNLMTGNPVTTAIFLVTRTVLNIVRSIEALIMAIIFVIIVGLGPFPGMIALTIHTTAALGKLFSEVIEGIDPGPIEAVKATGASWVQVVRYAVIPQVIPSFTGLTIYRWDINVRSSTIIGFVGGGGIGFFLWQWIVLQDFRAVGTAFVAIAVVVILMDFLSARIRERLV